MRLKPGRLATGLVLLFFFLSGGIFAQKTVTGKVTNQATNAPIVGASVAIQGTQTGTTTGDDGTFSLRVPSDNSILTISSVGFKPLNLSVSGRTSVGTVTLTAEVEALNEIVLTGYGTQAKKDLTGSISVVNVNELKQQPSASPIEALQGKATGVQIINDGAPGSTPQIRIRGYSTINNNDPLYIIDGVPYEGKLSWLNSSDIESMSVLKDASAASIYGSRANNGVVIITTRRGVKGTPRVSFDMYYGTQVPNRRRFPKFLNPLQYGEYIYQRFKNGGETPGTDATSGTNYGSDPNTPTLPVYLVAGSVTGQNVTAADADPALYNHNFDPISDYYQITKANQQGTKWFDEITRNAPMQNYQLSVTGGGENSTYAVSGSYFNQKGTFKYTNFERYTVRANTSFKFLNDRVTVGEDMQYSFTKGVGFGVNENVSGSYQGEASPIGWAYRIQTIVPVYDIMGNFAGTRGNKLGNADNPLAILFRAKDNNNNSGQFFGSVFTNVNLFKGLDFRSTYGVRYESFDGKSIGYPDPERSEPVFTNTLSEYQGHNFEGTWTNTLTYKNTFGSDHNVTVLLGTEAIKSDYRELDGAGRDFFVMGDLNYYYLGTAGSNSGTSEGSFGRLFSYFGRVDYAYKEKYLVSGTIRRDGSSNFGPQNVYGYFPAGSVAWRLSNENFLRNTTWINDLKLRVGYGETGNQSIPSFQYLKRYASSITTSSYSYSGGNQPVNGLWTTSYDNQAIKWESQKTVNVGLDFTLLDHKIDGSVEWYNKKTDGMLYPVPQPASAVGGGASPFLNSGNVKNTGVEFSVNYHYTAGSGNSPFTFDVGAFFTHYTNTLVELAPTVSEQPYLTLRGVTTSIMKAGAPLGAFYGYKVIGIYQDLDDIAHTPSYKGARIGGFKFADVSGPNGTPDGIIDGFDRTVIGNPHPDFIYSLSFNANYKRFDVSMFFNGSKGNDLFDLTRQYTDFYAFPGAVSTRTLDAWSPSNPHSAMPSPNSKAPTIEFQSSSYYVQNGSFFKMRNLQIGYSFPVQQIFSNNIISKLRVYGSVTNLFTITNYSGMDPEVSQYSSTFTGIGVDMGVYPMPRQYLLGVNVTF